MLRLSARCKSNWDADPIVARVTTTDDPSAGGARLGRSSLVPSGFTLYLAFDNAEMIEPPVVQLPAELSYLSDGDIVRFDPRAGDLRVLYRRNSRHNTIFTTERCNSNCLMCSQPPREVDDDHLTDAYLRAIPLMAKDTPELGITGGEPTLLGNRLLALIESCKVHLPSTSLHLLSNGRLFNYLSFCRRLAEVGHPDLMVGIPLYSDLASVHEFVVQAKNAFDQTVRGIMNLARFSIRVEIRVVLHLQTIPRLPDLARFLARNLPFVDQVALMGLEMMGYVRSNLEALWIDPAFYQDELRTAVDELVRCGIKVRIYNHQLCILDRDLWQYSVKSISDWKNEYLPECDGCSVRSECGGFFSSAIRQHSAQIGPVGVSNLLSN